MAATIRGTFELIDRASDTLRKIELQAKKTQAAVVGVGAALDEQGAKSGGSTSALTKEEAALKALEGRTKSTRSELENLTGTHTRVAASSAKVDKGFRDSEKSLRGLNVQLKDMGKTYKTLFASFRSMGLGGAGGAMIGGLLGGPLGAIGGGIGGAVGGGASSMFKNSNVGQFLQGKEAMKGMSAAAKDLGSAFKGLGSAFGGVKLGFIVTGIGPLIGVVSSLAGGLVAVLPKISDFGVALEALPAAASIAVQAMSVFKLALNGIGAALSAGLQMQNEWSLNQEQWAQQVVEAQDAVTQSQNALTNAMFSQQQAQVQLTLARRDATRELQDMEFAAKNSVLQEARAGLNIQQARLELQQAMSSPGTTQLQLESDRLAVLEAQSAAQQTHTQSVRSQLDYQRALRHDPTSDPTMKVVQAQHALTVAMQSTAEAEKGIQRAQWQLNFLMQQGNAGASAYKKALMAIGPAGQQFVKFLVGPMGAGAKGSFLQQFQALENSAAKGLFPPLEKGLRGLLGVWGSLESVTQKTGHVLGTTLAGILKVFSDPKWIKSVGDKNVGIMHTFGQGLVALARVMKEMIPVAQQFVQWVADAFDKWAQRKAGIDGTAAGLDKLRQHFKTAEKSIHDVWMVLKTMWDVLKNVGHAARAAGDEIWGGAMKGTKGWLQWTASATGQKDMRKWFLGLIPTLRAVKDLFEAIAVALKRFADPGSGGSSQATAFVQGLTSLLPTVVQILKNLEMMAPIVSKVAGTIGKILGFFTGIIAAMLKWKPLAVAVGVALSAVIVTRFVGKIASMGGEIMKLIGLWGKYKTAQELATGGGGVGQGLRGLFSHGTVGQEVGAAQERIKLTMEWGERSGDGPGSIANPLIVKVIGGSGGGTGLSGGSSLARDAERTGAEVTGLEGLTGLESAGAYLAGKGKIGSMFAKGAGKVPGLSSLGTGADKFAAAGAAAGEIKAAEAGAQTVEKGAPGLFAGVTSKLGGVADVLGKAALPLAAITTLIPAISAFVSAKGNVFDKLGAGASAAVNSAIAPVKMVFSALFGAPSKAAQYRQGTKRADASFGALGLDSQGLLTAHDLATARARAAQLQQQYNLAAHGTPTQTRGGIVNIGQDSATRQDRFAQLTEFNSKLGTTTAQGLTSAFATAIQNGDKPRQAMQLMIAGMQQEMALLPPGGQQVLLKAMASWGATVEQQQPQLKKPIDDLNSYITTSFQNTGQAVYNVNTAIMQQSGQQWAQISSAIQQPAAVMVAKLNGDFGRIQQEALNALVGMGYTKQQASALFGNVVAKSQGAKNINASGMGAQHGGTYAVGGRVAGSNPRDVYAYGGNMLGGGELVMNKHHEMDANARLMRHGEPTVGSIVAGRNTPHWFATGGRAVGGYVYPNAPGMVTERTDQGKDFGGQGAIGAIGAGKVLVTTDWPGWPGIGGVVYKLLSGPRAGRNVYAMEHVRATVNVGQTVSAGQQVAELMAGGTGVEEGWANASATGPLVPYNGAPDGTPMAGGIDYANFISGLAHGIITGGGTLGGLGGTAAGVKKMNALKVPQITGLGGVPLALAQAGADVYASGLQQQINKKLKTQPGSGMNFAGVAGLGGTPGQNEQLGRKMMLAAGWSASQWPALQALWTQESGWSANAVNPGSGAYGIPQALGHGHPYNLGDPRAQIAWGLNYIKGRYGSPDAAEVHEKAFNWYSGGGRIAHAGWFGQGGSFLTNGPTVFGAGEGGKQERITVEPAGRSTRPIKINIEKIEVHRKGDIKKIIDEELGILAESLSRTP